MVPPSPNSILMNLPNRDELLFLTVWQLRGKITKSGRWVKRDKTWHQHTTYNSDRPAPSTHTTVTKMPTLALPRASSTKFALTMRSSNDVTANQ